MEPEGVSVLSISPSPPLLTSDDHPDFSPAGSPDLSDHQLPALQSSDQPPAALTDDLRDKIIKQAYRLLALNLLVSVWFFLCRQWIFIFTGNE